MRARLSAAFSPANLSGWAKIGASGAAGRPARIWSSLELARSTARSVPRRRALDPGAQPLDFLRGMQPRIVADRSAFRRRLAVRLRRRLSDRVTDLDGGGVDLRAGLQRVAAVDKDRRSVAQHHRHPGRTGEPRKPRQALAAERHVFALVFI